MVASSAVQPLSRILKRRPCMVSTLQSRTRTPYTSARNWRYLWNCELIIIRLTRRNREIPDEHDRIAHSNGARSVDRRIRQPSGHNLQRYARHRSRSAENSPGRNVPVKALIIATVVRISRQHAYEMKSNLVATVMSRCRNMPKTDLIKITFQ